MQNRTQENPFLLAIGGHTGTGKTTLAHRLKESCPALQNALILEDDVMRRHLLGRDCAVDMTDADYTEKISAQTTQKIQQETKKALLTDRRPVMDCSGFFSASRQIAIEHLAQTCGVPFIGLWLTAPKNILRQRIKQRCLERKTWPALSLERGHASDADESVLEKFGDLIPPTSSAWHILDATPSQQALVDQIREFL